MRQTIEGALLVVMTLLFLGCSSTPPPTFYLLSPMAMQESTGTEPGPALVIGPVELPPHLDRPEIVTRDGGNVLQLASFEQWAEPLRDNVSRVLSEDIALLVGTEQVVRFPWNRDVPVDFQVIVDITRFDGRPGGEATLTARWTILDRDGNVVVPATRSVFRESAAGEDFAGLVSAMNRTLEALARSIAESLNR